MFRQLSPPAHSFWGGPLLFGVLLLVPACSHYSTTAGIAGGIRSVAIPVADNDTPEAGIAEELTERLSRAFAADGRLQVVDESRADASLKLHLTAVEDRPFTYTAAEETQQYRFKLTLDAQLLKNEDESQVLDARGMTGWGTYDAGLSDAEGRERAVAAALDMVVEELVDRATAGW